MKEVGLDCRFSRLVCLHVGVPNSDDLVSEQQLGEYFIDKAFRGEPALQGYGSRSSGVF
jgi:hypothetical protein